MNTPLNLNFKMIVTDLDGTLLRSDETLPNEVVEIIAHCKSLGVLFTIATSRSLSSTSAFIDILQPDAVIISGGAMAQINDRIVYKAYLSAEESDEIVLRCMNDKKISYLRVNGAYSDFSTNPMLKPGEKEYGHYLKFDASALPSQEVSKITACCGDIKHLESLCHEFPNCAVIPSYSGSNHHKIAHVAATKEDALAAVSQHFGITFDEIISFGDDLADLNMLQRTGHGVAVANARFSVKARADAVCTSNDDSGVAKYLSQNIYHLFDFRQ